MRFWAKNEVFLISCFIIRRYGSEKLFIFGRFWTKVDWFWSVFGQKVRVFGRFLTFFDGDFWAVFGEGIFNRE